MTKATKKLNEFSAAARQRFLLMMEEAIAAGQCRNKKEFALAVGEHAQNISMMEKGTRFPTIDQIGSACQQFGYSANWLILGKGPKKLDPLLDKPIEQRVSDLETQMRQVKKAILEKGRH